jgi:hypothetical protein
VGLVPPPPSSPEQPAQAPLAIKAAIQVDLRMASILSSNIGFCNGQDVAPLRGARINPPGHNRGAFGGRPA